MNTSMMQFEGVAAVVAIAAIIFLFAGYKLLASSTWLAGWLRGNLGILCVLLTGFFVLCVMDIRTYKPMFDDKTIATLSLRETSPQHYEIRLVDAMGVESRYSISGNSWYLTAHQFRWSRRLSLGLGHGYRFTTITGKYENASGSVTRDTLSVSRYFDVWEFMNTYAPNTFIISTDQITTTPEPLIDAAMYEVLPSGFDLVVKPLNELAKHAQSNATPPESQPQIQSSEASVTTVIPSTIVDQAPATQGGSTTQ